MHKRIMNQSGQENGTGGQTEFSSGRDGAKRPKLDDGDNASSSKVLHLRNIPSDATEGEVIDIGLPFGRVVNVLVLRGKNQAFLEMEDEACALAMVNYFVSCTCQLRGRSVYIQFSKHKELKTDKSHSNATAPAQAALQAVQAFSGNASNGNENTVLRIVVEHMVYPVTLDVLHQIFSRVGNVLKIVTFTRNGAFQALIQYADVITAQAAKLSLDGQNIYNACCTLRIDYSTLSNLNVRFNNDKSKDYTNPNLPPGDDFGGLHKPSIIRGGAGLMPLTNDILPGRYGFDSFGPGMGIHPMNVGQGRDMFRSAEMSMGSCSREGSAVILVSNLNENKTQCDHLFTLFGVYGDVHRVKILFNKKNTALIQMAYPDQAMMAIENLDRIMYNGKEMRVFKSKHSIVQLPSDGQNGSDLTKDYTDSALHRFKRPGSKNFKNIFPPSATLHLSNIPESFKEEDLRKAFRQADCTIEDFKFFTSDRRMALVRLASIEDAITALIKMHNYQMDDKHHLRVSFSKSSINGN